MFRKLLDAFSPSYFFQRLNKRRLQQEIDTHKLFLLARYRYNDMQGAPVATEEIQKEADGMLFEDQQRQLQAHLHHQVCAISRLLHGALTPGWEEAQIEAQERLSRTKRQSGLGMAVGGGGSGQPGSELKTDVRTMSREGLSQTLKERLGYTLRLADSNVPHADAGTGLFVSGTASPGSVVALYPGVIYDPCQYRQIPGYPRIDRDNPYFIARFDGVVIDAKPWGPGGNQRLRWDGLTSLDQRCRDSGTVGLAEEGSQQAGAKEGRAKERVDRSLDDRVSRVGDSAMGPMHQPVEPARSEMDQSNSPAEIADATSEVRNESRDGQIAGAKSDEGLGWWKLVAVGEGRAADSDAPALGGTLLETRHPLAFAHFANHPGEGSEPNVLVCPYDFHIDGPGLKELRPYVPNVLCPDKGPHKRADTPIGYRSIWETRNDEDENLDSPKERRRRLEVVRTLVLVASREIRDEEVLLNYRLSPHVKRPDWYHPVDADEDRRRWS